LLRVPALWLAPETFGFLTTSIVSQGLLAMLTEGTFMTPEAANLGVAAAARALYPEAYGPCVLYWAAAFPALVRSCSIATTMYSCRDPWQALRDELGTRGVQSAFAQQLTLVVGGQLVPAAAAVASVGLLASAVATRPRRSSSLPAAEQRPSGGGPSAAPLSEEFSDAQHSAWEEEANAALEHLKAGRSFMPTRRFGEHDDTYLHIACAAGDVAACEALRSHLHVLLGVKNRADETALHHAAKSGAVDVLRFLLGRGDEGGIVSSFRMDGGVFTAVGGGFTHPVNDRNAHAALLGHTPPHGIPMPLHGMGRTPLHEAALAGHVEATRYLLEKGCHVGLPCGLEEETPLAFAIEAGHLRVTQVRPIDRPNERAARRVCCAVWESADGRVSDVRAATAAHLLRREAMVAC
jgi:hypothetical protein